MPYEAMLAETVYIRGHNGDQIDAYFAGQPDASQLRRANKCARERMTVLYDQSAAFEALETI